ncbi:hypothetical protein RIF29_16611 [Crotalaria pallida]|uniref:CCHC-type domain-containing protein n=1 Tax=Crotalaria pallida TaxID=3830 RepID=A0AAN9FFN0_CROPI
MDDNMMRIPSDDDEEMPENKWYKESEEQTGSLPFDPCPEITVTKEEFDSWCKPWRSSLMVKVLGKRVNPRIIENKINRDWVRNGTAKIIEMPRDYLLVSFSAEEDYLHALYEGPWKVADHYLIVQRWRPFFLEGESSIRKIAVWVRIPNLPIELYNTTFLGRVGRKLGTMLKVDHLTSIHSKGKFSRICVEIDLMKKLVPMVNVLGIKVNLEYEGLHMICFNCGMYGHRADACPDVVVSKENGTINVEQGVIPVEVETKVTVDVAGSKEGTVVDSSSGEGTVVGGNGVGLANMETPDVMHENKRITNLASNINKVTADTVENPFGPWMLVKKFPKNKERLGQRGGTSRMDTIGRKNHSMVAGSGSRFVALIEDEEGNINEENISHDGTLHEAVMEKIPDSNKEKNPMREKAANIKEIKIRNHAGGKNQQVRGPKTNVGQTKDRSGRDFVNQMVGRGPTSSPVHLGNKEDAFSGNTTSRKNFTQTEKDILSRMKYMEQAGGDFISKVGTCVYLPSKEAHDLIFKQEVFNKENKPPDLTTNAALCDSSMELGTSSLMNGNLVHEGSTSGSAGSQNQLNQLSL